MFTILFFLSPDPTEIRSPRMSPDGKGDLEDTRLGQQPVSAPVTVGPLPGLSSVTVSHVAWVHTLALLRIPSGLQTQNPVSPGYSGDAAGSG